MVDIARTHLNHHSFPGYRIGDVPPDGMRANPENWGNRT